MHPRTRAALGALAVALFLSTNGCGDAGDAGASHAAAGGGSAVTNGTETTPAGDPPARVATPVPSKRPSGRAAPDFAVTLLNGDGVTLGDFAGQVLLIDFWATWCGPCRMSIPHLIDLQNEYGPQGLQVLGVSLDRGGVAGVQRFADRAGFNYPIAMGNQEIVQAYGGVQSIPMAFLVDREGNVAQIIRGYRSKEYFERAIRPLLTRES